MLPALLVAAVLCAVVQLPAFVGLAPPSPPRRAEGTVSLRARGGAESLTEAETVLVEDTWKQVEGLGAEAVGVLLFKNIFEIAPEAKGLFSFKDEPDVFESKALKEHGAGVVASVGAAVANLRDLSQVVPTLQALGSRHVGYKVVPEHYAVVGQALLKTLDMGLGDAFTPGVETAWTKVFAVVQETMLSEAEEPNAAA